MLKRQAGQRNLMHSKMKNPYAKENSKKWRDEMSKKEAKRLLMRHANQRVDFGQKSCKKCARPSPTYKKGHEPTCPRSDRYTPPSKEPMSVLDSKELEKIPNNLIMDFVRRGLLDCSVIAKRKQFDRAKQEKEKQQAIQQSTKRKKHPPITSPFFQPWWGKANQVVQKGFPSRNNYVYGSFSWKGT
jgi:hypothetical protein